MWFKAFFAGLYWSISIKPSFSQLKVLDLDLKTKQQWTFAPGLRLLGTPMLREQEAAPRETQRLYNGGEWLPPKKSRFFSPEGGEETTDAHHRLLQLNNSPLF